MLTINKDNPMFQIFAMDYSFNNNTNAMDNMDPRSFFLDCGRNTRLYDENGALVKIRVGKTINKQTAKQFIADIYKYVTGNSCNNHKHMETLIDLLIGKKKKLPKDCGIDPTVCYILGYAQQGWTAGPATVVSASGAFQVVSQNNHQVVGTFLQANHSDKDVRIAGTVMSIRKKGNGEFSCEYSTPINQLMHSNSVDPTKIKESGYLRYTATIKNCNMEYGNAEIKCEFEDSSLVLAESAVVQQVNAIRAKCPKARGLWVALRGDNTRNVLVEETLQDFYKKTPAQQKAVLVIANNIVKASWFTIRFSRFSSLKKQFGLQNKVKSKVEKKSQKTVELKGKYTKISAILNKRFQGRKFNTIPKATKSKVKTNAFKAHQVKRTKEQAKLNVDLSQGLKERNKPGLLKKRQG